MTYSIFKWKTNQFSFLSYSQKNSFVLANIVFQKVALGQALLSRNVTALKCSVKFLSILFLPSYCSCLSLIKCCLLMCQADRLCIMQKGSLLFLTFLSSCNQFLSHPSKYSPAIFEHCHSICITLSGVWNPPSLWLHAFIWRGNVAIRYGVERIVMRQSLGTPFQAC